MHSSDRSVMNGFRGQCVKSDCDDADIVKFNLSGDMIAEEDRINNKV